MTRAETVRQLAWLLIVHILHGRGTDRIYVHVNLAGTDIPAEVDDALARYNLELRHMGWGGQGGPWVVLMAEAEAVKDA